MKPTVLILASMCLYAGANVLIARRLAHITPPALMGSIIPIVLGLTGCAVLVARRMQGFTPPSWTDWKVILAVGVIFFLADVTYFSAYHVGGSIALVGTCAAAFPVAASLIDVATGGARISLRQLVAMLLVIVAVYLVSSGNPGAGNAPAL